MPSRSNGGGRGGEGEGDVIGSAERHCAELDIEAPLLTSAYATASKGAEGGVVFVAAALDRERMLRHLARCAAAADEDNDGEDGDLLLENADGLPTPRSTPHAERRRRESAKQRRRVRWMGGILGGSIVAVAVGAGAFLGGGGSQERGGRRRSAAAEGSSLLVQEPVSLRRRYSRRHRGCLLRLKIVADRSERGERESLVFVILEIYCLETMPKFCFRYFSERVDAISLWI